MLIADSNRTGPVETIIRSARRRRAYILALEEFGLALCFVLAGILLILVLGAQILDWYWLLLLAIIGVGLTACRVYFRRLSSYRIAQLLDSRLHLSDSLSTAWFLLSETPRRQNAAAGFQILRAEQLAARVNPSSIFRFRGGRAWAAAGALATVALGLFAIRYLVTSSLSIQQSIIPLHFGQAIEQIESRLGLPGERERQPEAGRPRGQSPGQSMHPNRQADPLGAQRSLQPGSTDPRELSPDANEAEAQNTENSSQSAAGQARGRNAMSPAGQSSPDTQSSQNPLSKNAPSQQAGSNNDEPGSTDQTSQGLMNKMKEALSSLMAKLRPNADGQSSNRDDQASQDQKKGDRVSAARDQKGNLQQSARNDQTSQEQNAEGAMRGRTAEKTQTSQNQSSDEASSRKGANMHSGIGHTNGDKDIKNAEQLKAMGKLAEIIGRRSANLTGDITIETSSTNQQLRTQYSGRVGQHADLGGEINRDEIPVMYRAYVREYMQLVHKQAEKQK